jgi:methyl-accepting chemotaxis protein
MESSWIGPVVAIALTVIAFANIAYAIAALQAARVLQRQGEGLGRLIELLHREASPTLQAARTAADEVKQLTTSVKTEVGALVGTSRDVRTRIERAVDSATTRLQDLDALLDVVQEEVEATALDVASTLRTVRRGVSFFGLARRALSRKRR